MFVLLLGWAYLSLCVGYYYGLREALQGRRMMAAIWTGIVSNGGACVYLIYYGALGNWADWGRFAQVLMWASAVATLSIAAGLVIFGLGTNN